MPEADAINKALKASQAALQAGEPVDKDHGSVLLLSGKAPKGLRICGFVRLDKQADPVILPEALNAETLDLQGTRVTLAPNIKVRRLMLSDVPDLRSLPPGLTCQYLDLQNTALNALPADLKVETRLDLSNCVNLTELPAGLRTGVLVLRGCRNLTHLPEGLDVNFLDVSGCTALRSFPRKGRIRHGRLTARDCPNLESLPDWLDNVAELDLRNCAQISALREGLHVSAWVDIAGTAIQRLPESMHGVGLRWRGVLVSERVVFQPQTLSAQEVLTERNAEVRRVMLERIGFERFVKLAEAKVLDSDFDKGGERRLLLVEIPNDENLVCVSFFCPSTGRQYVVRVPPVTKTCHAAIAWMAGFDDPDKYKPVVET